LRDAQKRTFHGDTFKLENLFTFAKIMYCYGTVVMNLVSAVCGGGAVRDLTAVL
jgi:hypothetical protein